MSELTDITVARALLTVANVMMDTAKRVESTEPRTVIDPLIVTTLRDLALGLAAEAGKLAPRSLTDGPAA